MFTGIITATGRIRSRKGTKLAIEAKLPEGPLVLGESIAVDGICLTVVSRYSWGFTVDVSEETFSRTNLGARLAGSRVNLERALTLATRLGGHLVSGHVDAAIKLLSRSPEEGSERWRWSLPRDLRKYVAMKGSLAVDGISLTVAGLGAGFFEVALIPHTLEVTSLSERQIGDCSNFEVDMVARYIESLAQGYLPGTRRGTR